MTPCPYCSSDINEIYHSGTCPEIAAIEYYPNGMTKRVEFHDRGQDFEDTPITLVDDEFPGTNVDKIIDYFDQHPGFFNAINLPATETRTGRRD